MAGLGNLIWKLSVALYLLATGVLGLDGKAGHLAEIITGIFKGDVKILVIIASVIAMVAGVLLILELFNIQVPILDTLILIVAIIWAVFIVFFLIKWIGSGFDKLWEALQMLGVYVMVFASLFISSKKFG